MNFKNIFALLLLGVSGTAIFAQTNMYVKEKTNIETLIPLAQIQSMNFSSGNISINKVSGLVSTYPLSKLRYLSFTPYIDGGITTEMNAALVSESFTLFPNPVQNRLYVQSSSLSSVEILNVIGEVIIQKVDVSEAGIDVASLTPGLYLCKICQGDTQIIKRFIKE